MVFIWTLDDLKSAIKINKNLKWKLLLFIAYSYSWRQELSKTL